MHPGLCWANLQDLRDLLERKRLGALELLDYFIERAERLNPALNAICEFDLERARQSARQADQSGGAAPRGILHGIPMTVKESFDVMGLKTARGVPAHRDRVAKADSTAVERLRAAGAIIFGKTNVPYNLADYQSFNAIHGVTRNPWNLDCTPGGSSGGSAAALAAGMTPVELGGDLGGSIRVPAHCCGVFGHRPSYGVVPFGRNTQDNPVPPIDIAAAGPMTRSAADLQALFTVLAGPDALQSRGWQLQLPPPRTTRLQDFRVAVWFDSARYPVDDKVRHCLEDFASRLAAAGAQISRRHPDLDDETLDRLYMRMIRAATSSRLPPEDLERQRQAWQAGAGPDAADELQGVFCSHREWLANDEARQRIRWQCAAFFSDIDILLCPVLPVTAWPHQLDPDFSTRSLQINGRQLPYRERTFWSALSGLAGLPATVMPAGVAANGMPVGVQIISGPFEDHTSLAFAAAAEQAVGGFTRPSALAQFAAPPTNGEESWHK
jgi:amidase